MIKFMFNKYTPCDHARGPLNHDWGQGGRRCVEISQDHWNQWTGSGGNKATHCEEKRDTLR